MIALILYLHIFSLCLLNRCLQKSVIRRELDVNDTMLTPCKGLLRFSSLLRLQGTKLVRTYKFQFLMLYSQGLDLLHCQLLFLHHVQFCQSLVTIEKPKKVEGDINRDQKRILRFPCSQGDEHNCQFYFSSILRHKKICL